MVMNDSTRRLELRRKERLFHVGIFFFLIFIYFWETERAQVGEEQERERDTESEAGSRLWAVSTELGRGTRTHEPWDNDLSWSRTLNRLSHPDAPLVGIFTRCRWHVTSWSCSINPVGQTDIWWKVWPSGSSIRPKSESWELGPAWCPSLAYLPLKSILLLEHRHVRRWFHECLNVPNILPS